MNFFSTQKRIQQMNTKLIEINKTNQCAKNSTTAKVAGVSFKTSSKLVALRSTA